MRKINLTQGKEAIIDDEDYELISEYKWYANYEKGRWYAKTTLNKDSTTLRMHRVILNAQKGQQIDHRDHNGLDNRKKNLRFASGFQQSQNRKKRTNCSALFKGVSWDKTKQKWFVRIVVNFKRIHLGYFLNEVEAAAIYDKAALKYFGEFACLNFG